MKAPETIYLQWYGDVDPELVDHEPDVDPSGASWCWEQIFPADIEYIRKESADAREAELVQQVIELQQELARYREREATMGWQQS